MDKDYNRSPQEVLDELHTSAQGLTPEEAEARLAKHGPNKLKEAEKPSVFQRFLTQLKDPMLLILIAAAAVSAVTNALSNESFTEVFIILAVVLLNAILGVVQESKAEAAIEALQTMTAAKCKVLRGGHQIVVESSQLVPGDVVVLEAGDAIPADGRLLECASLKIEEAALTGESVPVNKTAEPIAAEGDVPLGDRKNMCYMGSTVVYGRGSAVITATGMDTEMGKIAGVLARTEQEETPLQRKLTQLGKTSGLVIATGGGCVTRPENYPRLHQNGTMIFLERELSKLPKKGRPLSLRGSLQDMYTIRLPMYRRFADVTVANDGAPEKVAKAVEEAYERISDQRA